MQEKRLRDNKKGITLIALVVTIVVLLILAGITISLILGDNGIFGKASDSKEKWNKAEVEDQISTMLADYKVNKITKGTSLLDYLNSKKEEGTLDEVTDNGDGTITVELGEYELTIDSQTDTIISSEKAMARPTVENVTVSYINSSSQKVTAENNGTIEQGTPLIIEFTSQIEGGTVAVTTNGEGTLEDNNGQVTYTTDGEETEVTFTITGTIGEGTSTKTKTVNLGSYYAPPTLASLTRRATNKTVTVEDEYENKVVIPAGFKVVAHSGTGISDVTYSYSGDSSKPCVQDGIVIENAEDRNQFVWVPVGTINNKPGDTRGETTTITLGRYTFDSSGTPLPVQTNTIGGYNAEIELKTNSTKSFGYFELQPNRTSTSVPTLFGTITDGKTAKGNAIAIDINEWIDQANTNGGYYIGRYEASSYDAAGSKACSKKSTSARTSRSTALTAGMLWNYITQSAASTAAKAMYPKLNNDTKIYSDLVNSYAWDTAILFIQEYSGYLNGTTKYSKETGQTFSNRLKNTGTNGDKVCNIYDMASNTLEWTTEASTLSGYPGTHRGGYWYDSSHRTDFRYGDGSEVTFRSTLYVKCDQSLV